MKRISVDIGGTFTDCFFAWDGQYIQAKALTTHHNLAQGFNDTEAICHDMCAHDLFGHLRALIEAVHNRFVLVANHFELRVIGGVEADIGPHLLAQHLDLVAEPLPL